MDIEYSNSEIERLIAEYIHSAKLREILVDRLVNGLTFERLAEKHDYSPRYIRTLVHKAEDKLFKHLNM
ncbi:MAG: hypothetical protein IJP68_01545 [Selenomonadaceae bacterium]|nr:hypothetical protein [Selenomonadaceae bacterium]